ncbi:MAG: site-specific DNA-methyltransferase [Taibaiella sp.]|jgi:DNA modification methylase
MGLVEAKKRIKKESQGNILAESMIFHGDTREMINTLPDKFYSCCITSPPYWGLRDYGHDEQIGAEQQLDDYINHLVSIFRRMKDKLKDDGTFWLNIGDSYTSGNRSWRAEDKKNPARGMKFRPPTPEGLKPKDLIGIPWRLAFALQADGWYLRSDIIWYKPNCQPESVKDRPTQSHEYMFLFSKSEQYYYDFESIKEPAAGEGKLRNKRTVWQVNTEPFPEAHFATFPEELITPVILASSKKDDFILDPFFGAGTVGVASNKLGRKFHGIELKKEYIDIAKRRLKNAK